MPFWHAFQKPGDLSPAEEKFLAAIERFQMREGAYAMIQGTRPQTLADSLNDSPAGLAAWIVEKFQRWSDCDGDVEKRFTKDELLTNIMIYWATETIGSSFLPYYDLTHASVARWMIEKAKEWIGSSKVPAGFALFPKDLTHPPREWAQRFFNVQRWTEMPRGGHFAAMEEPELLAEDIRAFFRPLPARRLEHFPVKWTPVCVAKMRPNKEIEPRSDSIGTEKALVDEMRPSRRAMIRLRTAGRI